MKILDIISERQEMPKGNMGLTIFDIDDTLFHTTAQIKVIKDGKVVRSLTNQEFNNYQLQPGEEFDFGEFRSAEKFAQESEPIKPMINTLKRILDRATNTKVIMLTARADFDDKDKFLGTFEKYGIDMSRIHVHRAGNLPGDDPPAYKKAIWVRKYLNTGKYNRVNLIDDSMTNLKVFKSLEQEYPQVDFDAYFVKPSGSVAVVSESRRRKKMRQRKQNSLFSRNLGGVYGAWGPGPYGGYGYDTGYSGDGGGVESIREKIGDVSQFAEPGDTIYSIARQNNIDPVELMKFNNFDKNTKLKLGQEIKIPQKNKTANVDATTSPKLNSTQGQGTQPAPITGNQLETTLRSYALKAGIKGKELAQFLAQCAHESAKFSTLVEFGTSQEFLKRYDKQFNPGKAKELGNSDPGDGDRFKGRGFIQLTGRWNYTQAGQALGLPLDNKPELLEKPDIAAKASIWFWKNRVQPNVRNFTDTRAVTGLINPGLLGLQKRHGLFQNYLQTMGSTKIKEGTAKEDYHPNDPPPGPEFKPTMPKGTVRVDVSDVYDWYKLGQHISNLKGLGKHDFGKGPPSTIISFGSEEEEHKYINDLLKIGLDTTDIDPVDPNQPKNMRRQKVDPTFDVDENILNADDLVDVFIKGKHQGETITKLITRNFPNNKVPNLIQKLVDKYNINPNAIVYGPSKSVKENFADGRNPQDKGDSARHGIPKKTSISKLKSIRSSDTASPRKKQLAHWQINMRQGKKKE